MKKALILSAIMFDGKEVKYRLVSAEEIFINDNTVYQQIFNPLN